MPDGKRRSAAELIATHLNYDMAEMSDYRYQSTRWASPAIYALESGYYAAPTPANIGRLRKAYAGLNWVVDGECYGRPIYIGLTTTDEN